MVAVLQVPLDVGKILREVSTPGSGGIDVFIGTVRNHSEGRRVRQLEYTAYVPMAEKLMRQIEDEIRRTWAVDRVALVHRIGLLEVGEISVITAVSAAHRAEAFEACRYAIDRVKSIVPIWKKEHLEEGSSRVTGERDDARTHITTDSGIL